MIIIKNNWFPFGGYKSINLFGILFTKSNMNDIDLNHEKIHSAQMLECTIALFIILLLVIAIFNLSWLYLLLSIPAFYIWYGLEYLIIRLFNLKDKQNDVYHEVSFEEEAYNNQENLNYLNERKPFSWFKYLSINSNE